MASALIGASIVSVAVSFNSFASAAASTGFAGSIVGSILTGFLASEATTASWKSLILTVGVFIGGACVGSTASKLKSFS